MATNVPTSSNVVTSTDTPRPWTTTEVMVLTRCWKNVYKGVTPIALPHCLLGDEWCNNSEFRTTSCNSFHNQIRSTNRRFQIRFRFPHLIKSLNGNDLK